MFQVTELSVGDIVKAEHLPAFKIIDIVKFNKVVEIDGINETGNVSVWFNKSQLVEVWE